MKKSLIFLLYFFNLFLICSCAYPAQWSPDAEDGFYHFAIVGNQYNWGKKLERTKYIDPISAVEQFGYCINKNEKVNLFSKNLFFECDCNVVINPNGILYNGYVENNGNVIGGGNIAFVNFASFVCNQGTFINAKKADFSAEKFCLYNYSNFINIGRVEFSGYDSSICNNHTISNKGDLNFTGFFSNIKNFGTFVNNSKAKLLLEGSSAIFYNYKKVFNNGMINCSGNFSRFLNSGYNNPFCVNLYKSVFMLSNIKSHLSLLEGTLHFLSGSTFYTVFDTVLRNGTIDFYGDKFVFEDGANLKVEGTKDSFAILTFGGNVFFKGLLTVGNKCIVRVDSKNYITFVDLGRGNIERGGNVCRMK